MRQTSITSLPLPEGRVNSYAVHVPGSDGPAVPVSFDQARHVAVGPRPGSWMGVSIRPATRVDRDDLARAWLAVIARHETLQTVFSSGEDGSVRLHRVDVLPGGWVDHPRQNGESASAVVHRVLDAACSPFERPSYRLVLVESALERPAIILGSDHAHVDAWSLLVLVRDLMTCYADLSAGREPGIDLPAVPSFGEHTAELLTRPAAPEDVHRRWAEILDRSGGVMPRFPLPLGDVSEPRPDVVDIVDILDADEVGSYNQRATDLGVRMLPLTVSVMARVTAGLTGLPFRAVMPVHSRHDRRWHDSVGWFITNSVIEADDPDPHSCTTAVREAVALGSHPLAPIMAPYGGMPASTGMFAVSWLDDRRMPIQLPAGLNPLQISAMVPTTGVMVWFVTNDHGMHLRVRYPDTPEAHVSVGTWLAAVSGGIRALVGLPPVHCEAA